MTAGAPPLGADDVDGLEALGAEQLGHRLGAALHLAGARGVGADRLDPDQVLEVLADPGQHRATRVLMSSVGRSLMAVNLSGGWGRSSRHAAERRFPDELDGERGPGNRDELPSAASAQRQVRREVGALAAGADPAGVLGGVPGERAGGQRDPGVRVDLDDGGRGAPGVPDARGPPARRRTAAPAPPPDVPGARASSTARKCLVSSRRSAVAARRGERTSAASTVGRDRRGGAGRAPGPQPRRLGPRAPARAGLDQLVDGVRRPAVVADRAAGVVAPSRSTSVRRSSPDSSSASGLGEPQRLLADPLRRWRPRARGSVGPVDERGAPRPPLRRNTATAALPPGWSRARRRPDAEPALVDEPPDPVAAVAGRARAPPRPGRTSRAGAGGSSPGWPGSPSVRAMSAARSGPPRAELVEDPVAGRVGDRAQHARVVGRRRGRLYGQARSVANCARTIAHVVVAQYMVRIMTGYRELARNRDFTVLWVGPDASASWAAA